MADELRTGMQKLGIKFLVDSPSNQLFPILEDDILKKLDEKYVYSYQERVDEKRSAVRFCTCWATRKEAVDSLLNDLKGYINDGE